MEGSDGKVQMGVNGDIENLPSGFSLDFIIFVGKGITNTIVDWGERMRLYHKTQRKKQADITLNYLGYMTDNGKKRCSHISSHSIFRCLLLL